MHNRKSVSKSLSFSSSFTTTKDTSGGGGGSLLPLYQTSNGNNHNNNTNSNSNNNNNKNRRYNNEHNKLFNVISKNQLRNIYKSIIILITIIIFFRYIINDISLSSSKLLSLSMIDSNNNNNNDNKLLTNKKEQQQHRIGLENDNNNELLKENIIVEDNNQFLFNNNKSNETILHNNNNINKYFPNIELYPSLQYPFQHSSLIGIYFGASWCPMCQPITKLLDTTFRNIILKPPLTLTETNNETITSTSDIINSTKLLSIVYVSSDRTIDEMNINIQPNWFYLPYNNDNIYNERTNIKQLYKTCAKIEMNILNITIRKYEIPTLIILSSITKQVLTYEGIQDIYDHGINAINLWYQLDQLNIALLDKY